MKTQQSYRVKLAFGRYSVGAIIQPQGAYAQTLRQRGFIEPVLDGEPVATTPIVERATIEAPEKRKRGRPRKVG
jgi:hypothetical protein